MGSAGAVAHHVGGGDATAKLSEPNPNSSFYDRHDRNDPSTPTQHHQRQQRRLLQQTPPSRTQTPGQRSTPSSQHRLRRTPRFSATPSPQPEVQRSRQPPAKVTVILGPRGQYILAGADEQAKPRARPRQPTRQLSQDLSSEDLEDDEDEDSPPPPASHHHQTQANSSDPDRPKPHPALLISKRTHRAVLYTLEELLRGDKKLSSDIVEETASMADLLGGGGIASSNGNGTASSRTPAARAPAGSPSGIRGPRMIMQERAAREERQRLERERKEREYAEEEARALNEANRREAERRAAAGAGGTSSSIPAGVDPSASRRPTATQQYSYAPAENDARKAGSSKAAGGSQAQPSQRHGRTNMTPAQVGQDTTATGAEATAGPSAGFRSDARTGPSGTQHVPTSDSLTAIGRGRNSFPHAFERWETLSAHWEGLTGYWIRKLQQNKDEISTDPVSQQLARQVTDLSSAGANLFHAVVELQRLRASSERKFQRWFFETRAEMERNQEVTAMLEAALEEERQSRADAIREALEHERGTSKIQKQLSEMRKELTISKEEARRAWEELGRREQEERDRTASLQLGQPTIVGGVQVVPMTQGVSRYNSQREPQRHAPAEPEYSQASPSSRPEYTQAPAVQPVITSSGSSTSHQTPTTVHHQGSYGSVGTYSEGEYTIDAQGNFVRDSRGDKIPFRAPPSEGYSDDGAEEYETPAAQAPSQHPTAPGAQPQYSAAPDYTGASYTAPGWESMGARHHHPTRLSDVLEEEEERSRTSASQSQVSRG
ncbi:hypothetical protein BJ170DRAFT_681602 [Xylariales sp. AK1849]|nr:hypothetical protein BJ170DRAFT_681602 [Xylariales sp. AK1849]